jgi:hypothetical protein
MLQDRVAACASDHYAKKVSKGGKPKDDSEWTVYAAIVAERATDFWVVSCATGTKCTALRSEGCILHDTHAEVLARRGVVRVLWLELGQQQKNETNDDECSLLEESDNGNFQLRSDIQLHLYISDSPCGDASIYQVDTTGTCGTNEEMLYTGAKVVVSKETGIDAIACGGDHQLLDGAAVAREDTQVLGKLRTKSGRSNLPAHLRSSSMSCSDKIVQWCVLGLQGGLLSKYVAPIQLSSVVVSRDPRLKDDRNCTEQQIALERAIPVRVKAVWDYHVHKTSGKAGGGQEWRKMLPSVHVVSRLFASGKAAMAAKTQSVVDADKTSEQSSRGETKTSKKRKRVDATALSPCGFALNWQASDPTTTEQIVGARGIRQGKKPKSPEDYQRLSSRLSRKEFLRLYKDLELKENSSTSSYQETKRNMCPKEWSELKSTILQEGPLAGWLRNSD